MTPPRRPRARLLRRACLVVALGLLCAALGASPAAAAPAPAWQLSDTALPTNFAPGSSGTNQRGPVYLLIATNLGAAPSSGTATITATLPPGITPIGAEGVGCAIAAQTVTCTNPGSVAPGAQRRVAIVVAISAPAGEVLASQAAISGGGAVEATAQVTTTIGSEPPPFGFLPGPTGFSAPLTQDDGAAATGAGAHPYQLTVNLGFPTEQPVGTLGAAGHLHDAITDLPPGLIVDPAATPVLCTEVQLVSEGLPGCPDASQVGTISILTHAVSIESQTAPLYNMVPPPGAPAEFGFNAFEIGIFVHIVGGVRSDGDYGLSGTAADTLAFTNNPVFGVKLQLWGDPSSPAHDAARLHGAVPPQKTAFLTLPTNCSGQPTTTVARADDWEEPGLFQEASYQSANLEGNPVFLSGCNALQFEPAIEARPTTNLTDSPSGLDFDLEQPTDTDKEHRSPAQLRDATVTLPAGISVNPSQADGLGACSEAQIGFLPEKQGVHFSKAPDSCPDAAKLGTLEVTTPLLAQTDEAGSKVERDPEGNAIPRPLQGSVYLAQPFQNPFGSLIAIYLSINDPRSGTIAKLAGRVIPDPQTGQLTTVFEENPQLPLQDVKLHLFGGARGALITPPTCGPHTTTSDLTPWSTPEGEDAHPQSSFETTAAPDGGNCPATEAQLPNAPAFSAGTISPTAGAYSPFVLRLSREDGSQRLTAIDTTLPPGLSGRLAGIAECSDAQIAAARSREHPGDGILELQSPSCPRGSEVGTVDVAAGAGPTPYHTSGRAYLAGPYKSAPLSLVIITPAIAGPFDLGAVVVRTALHLEPESARIHAVSDPLPTILDGIPLDLRSIALKMDRPDFTLNGTSCEPLSVTGSATSALGQAAPLSSPFQLGGCQGLPFRPKLSLTLKGPTKRISHPALIANLTARPGEANIARAQVKLPKAAFLDNAHINTICTRVQFTADTCPAGSVYGKASATTPLLDYPLSGSVYLRSSAHKLPDLVVKLRGPDTQPIEVDLVGKTDSVKSALRNTFEAVPDAPVSKFRLELFGGKRGLIILSSGLCAHPNATVDLTGQNGKLQDTEPVVRTSCPQHHKKHKGGARR